MKPWLLEQQQLLSRQFLANNLPHAILINGVNGAGKLELAQWLLQLLACKSPVHQNEINIVQNCGHCKSCLLLKSHSYPDHIDVIAEKSSLGVDEIRRANAFLQKTAQLGQFKTILIDNAQTMTQAAANALLKTLEEPSQHSVIILLTNDIELLLPTIISRCRVLSIRPKVGQALLQSLSFEKIETSRDTSLNNPYVNLTQLPELTNPKTKQAFENFRECYVHYLHRQSVESELLSQLLAQEHALRWLEQITVALMREQFVTDNTKKLSQQLSTSLLTKIYHLILESNKKIKSYTQANKQFIYEQLIMAISEVVD